MIDKGSCGNIDSSMKFACTQENILHGLSMVGHIAGKSSHLPILENVHIKCTQAGIELSATNLEMAISSKVRGRVEKEGEFTVPAKLLSDYLSLLPAGKIEMELVDDNLVVDADGKSTKVKGMPTSEFPLIPRLVENEGYTLDPNDFRKAISRVAFAVSGSESRPELSGVACFFRGSGGKDSVVMAATDSYRLAEVNLPIKDGEKAEGASCIVPSRAMQEVGRILSGFKDDVETPDAVHWSMNESQLVISYGPVTLISRLIEGNFPDYKQIIPDQFQTTAEVDRKELLKAIRAASLFARKGLFDVHLNFTDDGQLTVSSSDSGTGEHHTKLATEFSGESNHATVNFKYISDGLNVIDSDRVTLRVIDGMNPILVQGQGDEAYRYVVMPIRH